LVALECFGKSFSAKDQQDWGHRFDIDLTLVRLTKKCQNN
jgi:hypothetical protein